MLISRSAMLEKECCGTISGNDMRNAPAVGAEPVRHGRWIHTTKEDDDWGGTLHKFTEEWGSHKASKCVEMET